MKELFSVFKEIFSKWKYLLIAVLISIAFYTLNVFISKFSSITSYYKELGFFGGSKLFIIFILSFGDTVEFHSFISLIMISVLLGLLFSLILYKTTILKKFSGKNFGFLGTTGIFLGILAPGCAACGVGLLSILGFGTAAITFLPYDGLELSILSIGILSFLTFKTTKNINKGLICEVKSSKN